MNKGEYYYTSESIASLELKLEKIKEGELDPSELFFFLNYFSKEIERIKKDPALFEAVSQEILRNPGVGIQELSKTTWSFKNVPAWLEKKEELRKIEEQSKILRENPGMTGEEGVVAATKTQTVYHKVRL